MKKEFEEIKRRNRSMSGTMSRQAIAQAELEQKSKFSETISSATHQLTSAQLQKQEALEIAVSF